GGFRNSIEVGAASGSGLRGGGHGGDREACRQAGNAALRLRFGGDRRRRGACVVVARQPVAPGLGDQATRVRW
ncbi:MAG: hypothetical protein ACK53L_19455, partial [Pirellulaceae bacterium]